MTTDEKRQALNRLMAAGVLVSVHRFPFMVVGKLRPLDGAYEVRTGGGPEGFGTVVVNPRAVDEVNEKDAQVFL